MTVQEFHDAFARLVAEGHGAKDVGLPEGFHVSGMGAGESVSFEVEENTEPEDGHPGFVWVDVRSETRKPMPPPSETETT